MEQNMQKYEIYKKMHEDLKKSMRARFYYQAIFIEYAIAEDRCRSALIFARVKYMDNKGREISLSQKINKFKTNPAFTAKYPRSRLTEDLLKKLSDWKQDRDNLVHHLAKTPYNDDTVREIAERGKILIDTLSNRVKSVNNYHKKIYGDLEIEPEEQEKS